MKGNSSTPFRERHPRSPGELTAGRIFLGHAVFDSTTWDLLARRLHASGRELQIVQGVFDDLTDREIGDQVGISPHTVHTYFTRLYHKLGVSSRVALVIRVFLELPSSSAIGRDSPPY